MRDLKRRTAAQPLLLIRTVHHEMRQAYGAGEKRRYNATTDSWHHLPVAANVLGRQFALEAPNRSWTSDITCIATADGLPISDGRDRSIQPRSYWLVDQATQTTYPVIEALPIA